MVETERVVRLLSFAVLDFGWWLVVVLFRGSLRLLVSWWRRLCVSLMEALRVIEILSGRR